MSIETTETGSIETMAWVCMITDLVPERGAAALVGGEQVALFRVSDSEVLCVQQLDPMCGAHVMSRGLLGSRGERLTVASPMHKQVFDLRTGECLDPLGSPPASLRVWSVQVTADGHVLVAALPLPTGGQTLDDPTLDDPTLDDPTLDDPTLDDDDELSESP